MTCVASNCLQTYSSNCVIYQGDSVEEFDVTSGLTSTEVFEIVLAQILLLLNGAGIDLSSIDYNCTSLKTRLVGVDKTLNNVVKAIVDEICANKVILDDLNTKVNTAVTYDTGCLTVTDTTLKGVIDATIAKLCEVSETVDSIAGDLTGSNLTTTINNSVGNYLYNNITSIGNPYGLTKTGSGSSTAIRIDAMVPPFCPIWSYAPLSNFNSDGSGKTGTAFQGWYICNGLNGTIDMRGWTPAGATDLPGISGPSLLSAVNPTTQSDATISTVILDRKGEVKHLLSTAELPAHTHPNNNSHSHNLNKIPIQTGTVTNSPLIYGLRESSSVFGTIATSQTAIIGDTGSTGSSSKHENRQPTVYGYFIVRLA